MSSGAPVWVGVDLGTQGARAVAVTEAGLITGRGERPSTSHRDGPRHEQDPLEWWHALAGAVGDALEAARPDHVLGLAVDGTSGTVLLVDADGTPLTAGLMYDDARAAELVPEVDRAGAEVWERLGYRRMQPVWALPKLVWLLRERPRPGARLAHQVDVVNRRLTGAPVPTDLSNALKTGADQQLEEWPAAVMDALGVPPQVLPPLVRPGTPIGSVCPEAAEATGLPVGTAVHAGATDGYAAQLASGALGPGSWSAALGTTLVLKGVTAEPVRDPGGAVYSHRAPDGRWFPGGASSTGAGVVAERWRAEDLDRLTREAAARGPVRDVVYPLARRGERFPFVADQAEGFALDQPTDEVAAFAATLLGVALVERLCLDVLRARGADTGGRHTTTGGGTRNAWWTQLRADVTRRDLDVPEAADAALGAAVLAASGASGDLAGTTERLVRTGARFVHDDGRARCYDEPYARLVDALEARGWLEADLADHARTTTGGTRS